LKDTNKLTYWNRTNYTLITNRMLYLMS